MDVIVRRSRPRPIHPVNGQPAPSQRWPGPVHARRPWHDTAMRRPIVHALVLAAAIAAVPMRSDGHVAPAIGDNNRYLKLSVLGDRVRLAYTVFYGELPGGALRRTLDRNHDGALDDTETQGFGDQIARDVAGSIVLSLDGVPQPIAWSQVVVGLGTPRVAAGAFSIDLVAWRCTAPRRGPHTAVLRDHYPIDRPGETEVKVEDNPGVSIDASSIGGAEDEVHDYKLVGPSGALDTWGLEVKYTVGAKAVLAPDATCPGDHPAGAPIGVIAGAAAATALVLAGAVTLVLRLRGRRRRGDGARRARGGMRRRGRDR
jgi:hypothetical protein